MSFLNASNGYLDKLRSIFGLVVDEDSMLDTYLKANYKQIPNFAYTQKRKVMGLSYPIYLNELVTPGSWKVKNLMRGLPLSDQIFARVRSIGNEIATLIEWTDDKNLDTSGDYYLYPSETLTLQWGDCEDHAFVLMSCLPGDCAGAWGMYKGKGHAFNVFVSGNELWVADTTGNEVILLKYTDQTEYKINYIITQKYSYQLDGGIQFGELAGWEAS